MAQRDAEADQLDPHLDADLRRDLRARQGLPAAVVAAAVVAVAAVAVAAGGFAAVAAAPLAAAAVIVAACPAAVVACCLRCCCCLCWGPSKPGYFSLALCIAFTLFYCTL